MAKFLTELVRLYQQKKQTEQDKRYYEVRYEWLKFFEQREKHLGVVQLPAFMLADQQMKIIMANGELNSYWKKIRSYKRRMAVVNG